MATIRVLIAEPHETIRQSLSSVMEAFPDIEKVGETNNGYETIRLCEELQPDVLLIGLSLQDLDSLVTTRLIYEKPRHPRIIMIDGLYGEEHEDSARKAGVDVYLTLQTGVNDTVEAIRASTSQS
jgi:DNA-binding NarL/FixJ family response regulator